MRQCPKCGKSEREIEMTTFMEVETDNAAVCPCGWRGRVGDLVKDFGKSHDQRKAELDAREEELEKREAALNEEKAPPSLGYLVTEIMPYLSEEAQVYLSEDNDAWKSGEVPECIERSAEATDDIDKMSKKQIVEALKTLGAEFDPKAKRDDLLAVFKAEYANKYSSDEKGPGSGGINGDAKSGDEVQPSA